jgi:hypothetical protein
MDNIGNYTDSADNDGPPFEEPGFRSRRIPILGCLGWGLIVGHGDLA